MGMKIVQGDQLAFEETRSIREGRIDKKYLFKGEEGSPANFVCGLYYQVNDFYAPRHRHNFDQWRYQLEGETHFGQSGTLKPGMLGYFPEGSYYGPNAADENTSKDLNGIVLVQFSGPSGGGYLSQPETYRAYEEMKSFGRFEKGIFYRNEGVPGKRATDAFKATWEHSNQRPLVYPKPQYNAMIMMDTNNYRWMPLDGAPGVEEKALGTFSDCRTRAAKYKLDPGATFTATGRGIFLALSGNGTVEGEPCRRFTGLYLDAGESGTFRADEPMEIMLFGLPDPARMRTQLPDFATADEADLAEVDVAPA
jgi:hypothetical protein